MQQAFTVKGGEPEFRSSEVEIVKANEQEYEDDDQTEQGKANQVVKRAGSTRPGTKRQLPIVDSEYNQLDGE